MATQFVIETGQGLPNSNSYATVAQADQYLENSGRKAGAWTSAGSAGKQAALVQAWFYMISRWRGKWVGWSTVKGQAGDWPMRGQFYPSNHSVAHNEIPSDILDAQIEYAYAMVNDAASELAPVPVVDDTGRTVTRKTEKVDVLLEQTEYSEKGGHGRNVDGMRAYPIADGLISWWVNSGSVGELKRN